MPHLWIEDVIINALKKEGRYECGIRRPSCPTMEEGSRHSLNAPRNIGPGDAITSCAYFKIRYASQQWYDTKGVHGIRFSWRGSRTVPAFMGTLSDVVFPLGVKQITACWQTRSFISRV